MPKDWKKRFKNELFNKDRIILFGIIYGFFSLITLGMSAGNTHISFGDALVVNFFLTSFTTLVGATVEFFIGENNKKETKIEKQESLEDIVRDIEQEMDAHASHVSKNDVVFLDEVKQLLHHITYVKRSYVLSEEKELEICIQPSSQLRNMIHTFFDILPENREVITEEYLPFLQKKRKQLYDTYMKQDQEETVRQFHQQASYLKEEKEYIYLQD